MSLPKWRLTRTGLLRILFALAIALTAKHFARAQEDAGEIVEAPAPLLSATAEATLNAIERQNPTTPTELVNAARILVAVDAATQARVYLDRVASAELDDAELHDIHKNLGTPLLVRFANDKSLPEARELVYRVFAAAKRIRRDPQRLHSAIQRLGDQDQEVRRLAAVELAQAGDASVPMLLDAIRNPPPGVSAATVVQVLKRLGSEAENAFIAAIGAPDSTTQSIAAQVLGVIGTNKSNIPLIRPSFSSDPSVQRAASNALQRLGSKPPATTEQAAAFLRSKAVRHLKGNPVETPDFEGRIAIWTWDSEQNNVVANRLNATAAKAVVAARLARDAYELVPSEQNKVLLLASRLQVDQSLNGLDQLLPKTTGSAYDLAKSFDPAIACQTLKYCLDHDLQAGAIGAAEVVADRCAEEDSPTSLKHLARALRHPNRRVRYAAARGIMTMDPRKPFSGSSHLIDTLIDLASASGRPRAIVASSRTDLRGDLAGTLGSLGFLVEQATDGYGALKLAATNSDYDVLLLSDSVSRPTAYETIQQLRKDPQSKHTPVILLVNELRSERSDVVTRLDDLTVSMPEFGDLATLTSRLEEVEKRVELVATPPTQRLTQATDALTWLGHFAKYTKTYPWYDVMRSRKLVTDAAVQPKLAVHAITLAGYLGDEESQKLLIDIASQESISIEDRQRAANAFGEAVLRRGLMLRKAQIYAQYDRYNASEDSEQPVQDLLGQILDIIETQTKPTSIRTPNE